MSCGNFSVCIQALMIREDKRGTEDAVARVELKLQGSTVKQLIQVMQKNLPTGVEALGIATQVRNALAEDANKLLDSYKTAKEVKKEIVDDFKQRAKRIRDDAQASANRPSKKIKKTRGRMASMKARRQARRRQ